MNAAEVGGRNFRTNEAERRRYETDIYRVERQPELLLAFDWKHKLQRLHVPPACYSKEDGEKKDMKQVYIHRHGRRAAYASSPAMSA